MPDRSTDPRDYQHLPQAVAAMPKTFDDGHVIPSHSHERDQLLYAISGVMRIRTDDDAWIVPTDRALYMPAGTEHTVSMHGRVEMRTLYIEADAGRNGERRLRVIAVSGLLRELILALTQAPVIYDRESRAGMIARLIEREIDSAEELTFNVPLPTDTRLQKLCAALLADPSDPRTLDDWAATAGASSRTLARLFDRDLGMSFAVWRQRIRFHGALEALSRGEPIALVAADHGYRSASAFTAAFRKVMGAPPTHLRRDRGGEAG